MADLRSAFAAATQTGADPSAAADAALRAAAAYHAACSARLRDLRSRGGILFPTQNPRPRHYAAQLERAEEALARAHRLASAAQAVVGVEYHWRSPNEPTD